MLIVIVPYSLNQAENIPAFVFIDLYRARRHGDTRRPAAKSKPNYASKQCDSSRVQTDSKQARVAPEHTV
jgi:hypothetical protein